ncbi:ileal sodium/bile acid cotransporter-like [Saccoglossus kowalevskii]|uniref:Solute carrier family 10 member 6-like n=1 Tax=Saccoglossus kowalevskii TaxID=10224 RepID=A0ABM0GWF7_SACKO|nr:PREDICTED: solute carrier family 10 member 6-like [Saccoglossus kowalevskii]
MAESTMLAGYDYNEEDDSLVLGIQVVSGITLAVVMFALGCTMQLKTARERLKKPIGLVIGAMSQFALMALLGFACVHIFELRENTAIGGVVLASCPGVFVSILFTMWMRGDIILSVCMTAILSVLAAVFTPLNIFIYTRTWSGPTSFINYGYIVAVIVAMLVPAALGALMRWFVGEKMEIVAKILFPISILLSIIILILAVIADPNLYLDDWRPWIMAWLYPLFALIVGYLAGFTACLTHPQCRTISIETACQNVALSIAIISITFPKERVLPILVVPVLYDIFLYLNCFLFLGLYRCCVQFRAPKSEDVRQIVSAPASTMGSISTFHTGVTAPGSITTVLPPGSYVNNALDLHNSFNKSFAPVVSFDPDTFDIGDKYGHQSVQTPHPDEGGFEEAGFRVLTPKKYHPYQDPERNTESEAYPDLHDMGTGGQPPYTGHDDTEGRYPPPIRESTPARAQDNIYEKNPHEATGYANYGLDSEVPPARPPPPVTIYTPPSDSARQRYPGRGPPDDRTGAHYYEPVEDYPKHKVTLDPRRDIHSNDYRKYTPDERDAPDVSGHYNNQDVHPNGDLANEVTESEV